MIKKEHVLQALDSIEDKLFGTIFSEQVVPRRLANVFVQLYIKNWYPSESIILIQSYQLLEAKGYYYDQ